MKEKELLYKEKLRYTKDSTKGGGAMREFMKSGSKAIREVEEKRGIIEKLAKEIWENPECAFQERIACEKTAAILRNAGFQVETGAGGVPTAIRAQWGSGHPVVGFLGEYDALPGLSQKVSDHKEPVTEGACGHGCGHNLLGAAAVGGALGMKAELEEKGLPGTVVFYGCPGEEVLCGKPFMARGGCFFELDLALSWHPGQVNQASVSTFSACSGVKFHYTGVTSHAAGDPWNGRSALDAVQLLNMGAEFMREHVSPEVRIHYSITDGGGAPNIVPGKASVWYYVRALDRNTVNQVYDRLVKAAKGAAMMTETKLEIQYMGGCYPMVGNRVLAEVMSQTMKEIEQEEWTAEELKWAKAMNQPVEAQRAAAAKALGLDPNAQIFTGVAPVEKEIIYASTDVGDVAHIVPTIMATVATAGLGTPGHSWQMVSSAGGSIGLKGMIYAAKVLAASGVRLAENPALVKKAKEEFDAMMDGESYICPIPQEMEIPEN